MFVALALTGLAMPTLVCSIERAVIVPVQGLSYVVSFFADSYTNCNGSLATTYRPSLFRDARRFPASDPILGHRPVPSLLIPYSSLARCISLDWP